MKTINITNEADFLANSAALKEKAFIDMCKAITGNYNQLANANLVFSINRKYGNAENQPSLFRLFDKLYHMAFTLYSPQSIPDFLKRIVTKPIKVIARPLEGYENTPEIYGKGHFRWDFKAYTLNDNELQAIRMYLGLHIKEAKKTIKAEPLQFNKEVFDNIEGYEEKAAYFLNATGTTFSTEFKAHDYYFEDDKDTRDIYNCVLKNKTHRYRFTFGQSIADSKKGETPTAYDILSCLQKSDPYDFKNFCSDFGYDADSRKAYKAYKAVMREWKNVEKLFTPEEIEMLQEIN